MSYLSTDKRLTGNFKINPHAVTRFKQRHGNKYIGPTKIKNMSDQKLKRKIKKSLRERVKYIKEQDDGYLQVYTYDFKAIVMPYFRNTVITII